MLRPWKVPDFFHDVLGEEPTPLETLLVFGTGAGVACALFWQNPALWQDLVWWRQLLAFLLVLDIAAGCLANFTASTSNYYARRPGHRLVFISVHLHLLAVAWLLALPLGPVLFPWIYTVLGAFVVNALIGHPKQRVVAGLLLMVGLCLLMGWPGLLPMLQVVAVLFLVKVLFAFGVDHEQVAKGRGSP